MIRINLLPKEDKAQRRMAVNFQAGDLVLPVAIVAAAGLIVLGTALSQNARIAALNSSIAESDAQSRALAPQTTLHGVFMEIYSIGVLITGESGAGKSELALELITRGHRLVADDAPEFTQIAPDVIDGTCPAMLQDMLEVRGLGVMNIRQMFGDTAVKRNKYLRLIVNLIPPRPDKDPMARLTGEAGAQRVLDLDVPVFHLPVAPGRNLAVMTEAAVRLHILRSKGEDPAAAFLARHSQLLSNSETNA